MMLGVYLGQFCINCLTVFFATWFIPYLVEQRGLSILNAGFVASVPAICGFVGGVLGGVISDAMLRKGYSITAARKTPIVGGMLLATSLIICNYVDAYWLVILVIALSFFGKGIEALGWTVVSEPVREVYCIVEGLASRRSMRRIMPSQRKASAFTARFAKSLASRRQRPSQANVLSTIHRLGRGTKPSAASRATISSRQRPVAATAVAATGPR